MNYTIVYMRPLGEYDSKYGQKYWGKVEESDLEVSFNLMSPVNFDEGDNIEYEEKIQKETKNGKEYYQLRKVHLTGQKGLAVDAVTPVAKAERSSSDYEPGTNARWAIGMAYRGYLQVSGTPPEPDDDNLWNGIGQSAIRLVKMFDKVKAVAAGAPSPSVISEETHAPEAPEEEPEASGYAKAKATATRIRDKGKKELTREEAEAFLAKLKEEEEDTDEG